MGNSNPGLVYDQVPTAAQWNSYFSTKQDWNPILDQVIQQGIPAPYSPPATTAVLVDGSGASLVFTAVTSQFSVNGNTAALFCSLTYPTTANTSAAIISGLPQPVPNIALAKAPGPVLSTAGVAVIAVPVPGSSTIQFVNAVTGVAVLNSALSGKTISFLVSYPVS